MNKLTTANPYPITFEGHVKSRILSWKEANPYQEIRGWPHPQRMARYAPNGAHIGFNLVMRVSVELGGWCTGIFRDMYFILPIDPEKTDDGYDIINRIAAAAGIPLQPDPAPRLQPQGKAAELRKVPPLKGSAVARHYNKSPARAVRLRRAARTAMRHGYF